MKLKGKNQKLECCYSNFVINCKLIRNNYSKPTCSMIHFHFVYPWFKFLLFIHLNFNQLSIHYPPSLKSMIKMYFLFLFISPPKNNKKLGQSNIRLRGQLSSFLDLSLTHSIVSLSLTPSSLSDLPLCATAPKVNLVRSTAKTQIDHYLCFKGFLFFFSFFAFGLWV